MDDSIDVYVEKAVVDIARKCGVLTIEVISVIKRKYND